MLKLLPWLHRQDSQETIELFHVKITALLNAGHQIVNILITAIYGVHFVDKKIFFIIMFMPFSYSKKSVKNRNIILLSIV